MKAALVGCGVIGQRRVEYFPKDLELVAAFDPVTAKAESLKKYSPSLKVCQSLEELLALPGLDCVFVAGINSALAPTCAAALNRGLHVLVEKPGARSAAELSKVSNPHGKVFKVGFNHRFHPAFFDILDELKKNPSDPIMYMRASYGNGARLGSPARIAQPRDFVGVYRRVVIDHLDRIRARGSEGGVIQRRPFDRQPALLVIVVNRPGTVVMLFGLNPAVAARLRRIVVIVSLEIHPICPLRTFAH